MLISTGNKGESLKKNECFEVLLSISIYYLLQVLSFNRDVYLFTKIKKKKKIKQNTQNLKK